jgi:2-oxoglutarate dehydrogenase E1 component
VSTIENLDPQSLAFVETLYADYLRDRQGVSADWREYFDKAGANGHGTFLPAADVAFPRHTLFRKGAGAPQATAAPTSLHDAVLQERVGRLMHAFRVRGHIVAHVDPLGTTRELPPELDLAFYGLTETDLDRQVAVSLTEGGQAATLRQVLVQMRNTYCRFIGAQFMHIDELEVRRWLQHRMERSQNRLTLKREEQLRILRRLTDSVIFEEFVQKKYVGAKSFSLEGAESLIPLLDLVIEKSAEEGVAEIVLGMAHRGRLNVLANVMGKRPREIFREFEDANAEIQAGHGDVKYHLGYSSDWNAASGRSVHLSLCFNPSHLEFVNTVALGRMRAKGDRFGDSERRRGTVILIHGDAAFAGEGIVQETLNLSGLAAYTVGGTIHVIVNNQIGFTTPPAEGRSSTYATDVAKMLQVPIFHVNGEDPEAVAQVVQLALDFRREFQRDVVIDMYCYRRRGHNEGDEPALTQPLMYRLIEQNDSVRDNYVDRLLLLGEIGVDEAEQISEQCRTALEKELELARSREYVPQAETPAGIWAGYTGGPEENADAVETGLARDQLAALLTAQTEPPEDFHPHPKIARWLSLRREMADGKRDLDWAAGEALALATVAAAGHRIRLTGQDAARGTFSQRHAVLIDFIDNHPWMPLAHLAPGAVARQAPVEIANSPLSEAGVLGFEYGYSLDCPEGLVLWEAQYGDFCNAAQVIIDQFIVSAEDKWRRLSGLVLLLPHGLEGQGAEHSSARLERFLALAAADNIQIACPTTPAQYFHLLRRQTLRKWRKPLVVMTPKSLLRHARAVSPLADCAAGSFQTVIADSHPPDSDMTRHVLLCSGKVYYDLARRREELKRHDVALVRIEQLNPFPEAALRDALAHFPDGTRVIWVQEEPENMGAWQFLRIRLGERLFARLPLSGICRPASASPATGSMASFKREQERLLSAALGS